MWVIKNAWLGSLRCLMSRYKVHWFGWTKAQFSCGRVIQCLVSWLGKVRGPAFVPPLPVIRPVKDLRIFWRWHEAHNLNLGGWDPKPVKVSQLLIACCSKDHMNSQRWVSWEFVSNSSKSFGILRAVTGVNNSWITWLWMGHDRFLSRVSRRIEMYVHAKISVETLNSSKRVSLECEGE